MALSIISDKDFGRRNGQLEGEVKEAKPYFKIFLENLSKDL